MKKFVLFLMIFMLILTGCRDISSIDTSSSESIKSEKIYQDEEITKYIVQSKHIGITFVNEKKFTTKSIDEKLVEVTIANVDKAEVIENCKKRIERDVDTKKLDSSVETSLSDDYRTLHIKSHKNKDIAESMVILLVFSHCQVIKLLENDTLEGYAMEVTIFNKDTGKVVWNSVLPQNDGGVTINPEDFEW